MEIKKVFLNFVAAFGKRRSKKQKKLFAENVLSTAKALQIPCELIEEKVAILTMHHLVIGDLRTADTIVIAGYDTRETNICGRKYRPFDSTYNRNSYRINTWIFVIISIILMVIAFLIFYYLFTSEHRVTAIVVSLLIAILAVYIGYGHSNQYTFSKSVSVLMILSLMQDNRDNVAYILVDFGSYSKVGIDSLVNIVPDYIHKNFVYLDCMATGNILVVEGDKDSIKRLKGIFSEYPFAKKFILRDTKVSRFLEKLPNCAHLCLVNEENENYVAPYARSENDRTIEFEKIDEIVKCLNKL